VGTRRRRCSPCGPSHRGHEGTTLCRPAGAGRRVFPAERWCSRGHLSARNVSAKNRMRDKDRGPSAHFVGPPRPGDPTPNSEPIVGWGFPPLGLMPGSAGTVHPAGRSPTSSWFPDESAPHHRTGAVPVLPRQQTDGTCWPPSRSTAAAASPGRCGRSAISPRTNPVPLRRPFPCPCGTGRAKACIALSFIAVSTNLLTVKRN